MYNARKDTYLYFLEWVPFNRFTNIKEIEGGFSKVYSTTLIGGRAKYVKRNDGSWKKHEPKPMKVALKRLNESLNNISAEYLNEIKIHWNLFKLLPLYGVTKDPETKEFMIIVKFANKGNLRSVLSNNFNNIYGKKK